MVEPIGQGSMGVVYKVSKDGQFYAAKVLISNDVGSIARFRKETAAISRFNHPSLVKVIDVGESNGEPFMVMELLTGKTIDKLVGEFKERPSAFLKIFVSIAGALAEVHRFKMVHRDVKPENFMMTEGDEAKLLDLGLAGTSDELKEQEVNTLVGTAIYSSPEQSGMLKRPVDARSDLYSLGVSMFEIATGRPPFISDNISELMQLHASSVAPRASEFNPKVSPAVDLILSKLLAKDPDDRYQTARGLLNDLESIPAFEKALRSNETVVLGTKDHASLAADIPLVGRDAELAILNEIWDKAKAGKGGFVVVEGEGGNGKSRLIQEALIRIKSDTQYVFKGKCQKIQNGIPFFPFREGFDDFLMQPRESAESQKFVELMKKAAGQDAEIIRIMSRGFEKVFEGIESRIVDRQVFNQQFTRFLLELCKSLGSVVFVIDDIQWADDATINLLATISENIGNSPFQILMSARNDKDSVDRLNAAKERIRPAIVKELELQPLALDATDQVLAFLLGGKKLDREVVKKIQTASHGNPFAIGEFARSLLESGNLQLVAGEWKVNQQGLEKFDLSTDVFQIILSRVESMPGEIKRVLTYGAVIGNTVDLDLLCNVSQSTKDDINLLLESAVSANLLERSDNQKIKFVHDRIRESLISGMSKDDFQKLNSSLAEALDKEEQHATERIFDLARYYASGHVDRNLERVLETNLRAGRLAYQNFSYEQAYEMMSLVYNCATSLGHGPDQITPVIRDLVEICILTARLERSHQLIDELLKLIGTGDKAEALYLRLKTLYAQGFMNAAWEAAKDALEAALNIKYPDYLLGKLTMFNKYLLLSNLLAITGFRYGWLQKPGREKQLKKYRLITEILDDAFILSAIYKGRSVDGMIVVYLTQFFSHFMGDCPNKVKGHAYEAMLWSGFTFVSLAKTFLDRAKRVVDKLNDPKTTAYYNLYEQYAMEYGGDPKGAGKKMEVAIPMTRTYLEPFQLATVQICKLNSLAYRSYPHDILQATPEVYVDVDKAKQWGQVANARTATYTSLVLMGQPTEAVRLMKELHQIEDTYCKDTEIFGSMWAMYRLMSLDDMDETDVHTELLANYFLGFKYQAYYCIQGLVTIAYIRLANYEKCFGTNEELRTRRQLGKILRKIYRDVYTPLFRSHYFIVKAGFYRINGRCSKAMRYLDHAFKLVEKCDSPYAIYRIFHERAKVYKQMGDQYSYAADVFLLQDLCKKHGWTARAVHLERVFGDVVRDVAVEKAGSERRTVAATTLVPLRSNTSASATRSGQEFSIDRRIVNALLQVSLVSTKSFDPTEQSNYILDEVVRLFGAERGFVFLQENWEASSNDESQSNAI